MKFLIGFFLSVGLLFASGNNQLKIQILEKIILDIQQNERLKVWSDDKSLEEAFRSADRFDIVQTCESADLIILARKKYVPKGCETCPVFVLSYELLKDIPESFGALFWKKGRPNIVFIESRLKKFNITLSDALTSYVDDQVW